ncbi:hypothetical protein SORBI_3005G191300 [Sorghum bicolor]|uniref:MATH domain-containing protein n=1 Tax=Sorghum bicolor TaxID=4558 RepID=A0A1Z5RJC1_SORBI|nr:hypothetical protein SORBI_3005G191300 [Sorghum bicolor]
MSTSASSSATGDDDDDSGSTSTITAETTTGRHELKGESYTRTKGGVGKFIDSVTFRVGGHSWYIRYYPDGNRDESADWISVYLYLDGAGSEDDGGGVKARYKFSLFRDAAAAGDGEAPPVLIHTRTASNYSFWSADQHRRGYCRFIKATDMEEATKGGGFCIRCDVAVMKETCVETTMADSVTVPASELNQHLGALLDSKVGGDVTFDVGGEQFTAHRIQIDDVEPRVFRALLHFIYTDSLPEIDGEDEPGMAQHLLVAADKYGMQRLKLMCEAMLLKHIDTSVLATTLTLAEQHDCQGLKDGCFKFLRSPGNTKAVVESDGFQHLRSSCPSLIEEMLVKVAP